jgi:hypothetical protein
MPEAFKAPAELSGSCRALRSLDSTLLACSSKRRRRQRHPLPHHPLSRRLLIHPQNSSVLHRSPSKYQAGTCREHAQAKYAKEQGHADFTSSPSSDILSSRYTDATHARATPPTNLSIAHCTHHHRTSLRSPPPALLLFTPPPPPTTAVLHSLSTALPTQPSSSPTRHPTPTVYYHNTISLARNRLFTCKSRQIGIQYSQLFFKNTIPPLSCSSHHSSSNG